MAFVFRAEKKDIRPKINVPGPGQYESYQPSYQPDEPRKPFNSSVQREYHSVPKEELNIVPGPGAYNITGDLLKHDKTQNLFFMPANTNETIEQVRATNVFKSKAQRGNTLINPELPGPGAYYRPAGFGRKYTSQNDNSKQNKNMRLVHDLIRNGKAQVPSIPSNVHSYGYTENDEHELVLNRNPITQVQQFVGPGYYEPKKEMISKYKGPAWGKSNVKKVGDFVANTATTAIVGPGSYLIDGSSIPDFKAKPNAGFVSTTTRSFDAAIKQKLGFGKYRNRTPLSSQSDFVGRHVSAMETDDGDESSDDEYIKDATPGPGYYHNESMISSFGTRTSDGFSSVGGDRSRSFPKATKPPAFGSSQRFKEQYATTMEIGPGEYDVHPSSQKDGVKYTKVPFQSSNTRFDREGVVTHPGPGTYNPPIDLLDRVKEKGRTGYVGSFGNTEKRFKISKLLEETPGPGFYTSDPTTTKTDEINAAFKKGAHFFTSVTTRNPFDVKNEVPAPGTYSLEQKNIATKLQKKDEDSELPKRYPFNSGQARFEKPKEKPIPEDDDEEDDEDDEPKFGASRNLESLLKSKAQTKPNAVFKSSTLRKIGGMPQDQFPGPGAYQDLGQNPWNKRTFNIHFTGD